VFPLRDINPTDLRPVVTALLIAATVALWVWVQGGGLSAQSLEGSICRYGLIPTEVTGRVSAGDGPCALGGLTRATVVTSMFMHGSWMHLIGNMWFLWVFGNNIEDATGHGRFLLFYLLVGVLAAAAHMAVSPGDVRPMVGASGAVSGIMGAYLVLYPKARVDTLFFFIVFVRVVPLPAYVMLGYWMVLQLLLSSGADTGVATMAHIGGFVAGVVLITLFRRRPEAMAGVAPAQLRGPGGGRW
jgi:membrane associated rhomboid family serine protease